MNPNHFTFAEGTDSPDGNESNPRLSLARATAQRNSAPSGTMESLNMLASITSLGGKLLNTPTTSPVLSNVPTNTESPRDESTSTTESTSIIDAVDPALVKMVYNLLPPGSGRDCMIEDIVDNQSFLEAVDLLMSQEFSYRPTDVLDGEVSLLTIDQLQLQFESEVSRIDGKHLFSKEGIDALDELILLASNGASCSFCDKVVSKSDYEKVVRPSVFTSCIASFPPIRVLRTHLKDPRSVDSSMSYVYTRVFGKANALDTKVVLGTRTFGLPRRFMDCRNAIKQALAVAHVFRQRSRSRELPSVDAVCAKLLILYKLQGTTANLIARVLRPAFNGTANDTSNPSISTGSLTLNAGTAQTTLGGNHSGDFYAASKHVYHAPVYQYDRRPPVPIDTETNLSEQRCCAGFTSPFSPRQSVFENGSAESSSSTLPPISAVTRSNTTQQTARNQTMHTSRDATSTGPTEQTVTEHNGIPKFPLVGPLKIMRRFLTKNGLSNWEMLTNSGWELCAPGKVLCNVQVRVSVGDSGCLAVFREGLAQKPVVQFDLLDKGFKVKVKQATSDSFLQIRSSSGIHRLASMDASLLGRIEKDADLAKRYIDDLVASQSFVTMMAGADISDEE